MSPLDEDWVDEPNKFLKTILPRLFPFCFWRTQKIFQTNFATMFPFLFLANPENFVKQFCNDSSFFVFGEPKKFLKPVPGGDPFSGLFSGTQKQAKFMFFLYKQSHMGSFCGSGFGVFFLTIFIFLFFGFSNASDNFKQISA